MKSGQGFLAKLFSNLSLGKISKRMRDRQVREHKLSENSAQIRTKGGRYRSPLHRAWKKAFGGVAVPAYKGDDAFIYAANTQYRKYKLMKAMVGA